MECADCGQPLIEWSYICRVCNGMFCGGCVNQDLYCLECEEIELEQEYG